MKYHKETVKCGKCGKTIRFPASGLNQGKIHKMMGKGVSMYCDDCLPPRFKAMLAMSRL